MSNPWVGYYTNQAGTGIAGYQGARYQRGHGLFGTILNFIKPFAGWLGRHALSAGTEIGGDLLRGENFKESAKKRLKTTARSMVSDAVEKAQRFAQSGSGRRRRRGKKKSMNECKSVKKTKGRKKTKKFKNKTKKSKKKVKAKKRSVSRKKASSKHLHHLFS